MRPASKGAGLSRPNFGVALCLSGVAWEARLATGYSLLAVSDQAKEIRGLSLSRSNQMVTLASTISGCRVICGAAKSTMTTACATRADRSHLARRAHITQNGNLASSPSPSAHWIRRNGRQPELPGAALVIARSHSPCRRSKPAHGSLKARRGIARASNI